MYIVFTYQRIKIDTYNILYIEKHFAKVVVRQGIVEPVNCNPTLRSIWFTFNMGIHDMYM